MSQQTTAGLGFANTPSQIAALKELYKDSNDYLKNLVYKENPFLALVKKDESIDGAAGKYIPVPIEYGATQGRSHTFSNAQGNQSPTQVASFFVAVVQDYSLVTITNLLMEQTRTSAGAFVDACKLQLDGGFRTITNNIAFELFSDGQSSRGTSTSSSTQNGVVVGGTVLPLSNSQQIVNFEINMVLVASATNGGAPSTDTVLITGVDRVNGIVTGTASANPLSGNWAIGTGSAFLSVQGDLPSAGFAGFSANNSSNSQALCGLGAWLPITAPASNDNFWGVNRSVDTRLGGLRYNAQSYTIEEGITNALAFMNREGARPDLCIMDFASYSNLVNALGAKVQYVTAKHDEVEVAFDGILFQSAYGKITVLADRNCPPQSAYILSTEHWKLRSLGKVPHILTYGMEGLEGLRVGSADALEIRIGYYGNLICSAPGWSCVVQLSA